MLSIHKLLYTCLTIAAICFDLIRLFRMKLQKLHKKLCDLLRGKPIGLYEIEYLEKCKLQLQKIPKHLCIIVGPNDGASADILSRIAMYALILDIDYISFYDTRTIKVRFTLDQLRIPKYVSSRKTQNERFLWSMPDVGGGGGRGGNNNRKSSGQLKYKNGLEKSIEVVMLNSNQGRPLIAEICRKLHTQRDSEELKELLKNRARLSDRINNLLAKKLNHLPEPEMAIVFNKFTCTFGLMPWHTSFTEFYTIETSSHLSVDDFAKVLYRFSRCEQRFGK